MCIDSLIAINGLSLAAFPLFIALPYTGKTAKLKLSDNLLLYRESNLSGIYEDAHTLKS